jgi:hypothetical protein
MVNGIYVVTAQATLPSGRCDESIGAVPTENLKGENLSNAMLKAETKAKRRVTLAICGLSMMDETEVDSIPQARSGKALKATRTLDDVASYGHAAERAEDEPAGHAHEPTADADFDAVTGEVTSDLVEPSCPCPRFGVGQHKGKLITEVPAGYLRWCVEQSAFSESSTDFQQWIRFCISRREREKAAALLAEQEEAEKFLSKESRDDR